MQAALLLLVLLASLALPAFPQPQSYHAFADDRTFAGIANFWNTASNLPFVVVGIAGLLWLLPRNGVAAERFVDARERWPYVAFFGAVLLTGFGSAWYHLAPSDATLVWDRLPLALLTGAIVTAGYGDHVAPPRANRELVPILLLSLATVLYWGFGGGAGAGNLAPYLLLQAYAVIALIAFLAFMPARYDRRGDFMLVFIFYALARAAEWLDRPIYEVGGWLSGHTLKHLLAALASAWVLRMIRLRKPLAPPSGAAVTASPVT